MIKFNQKGMTLVEILMALGISAGITLVGAQLMGEYYSNQNYTEVQADIQKTMIQAQRVMGDKEICNKIFNAYPLSETFSPMRFITAIKGKTPSNPALTEQDVITLGNKGKYNINRIWVARNENNENLKNIVFQFTWPNKKFVKSETFVKSFSIFVARDTANNRWSCGEVVGENSEIMKQELCLSLNGTNPNLDDAFVVWTPGSPGVEGKCEVKQFRCGRNQIPMRLSSLGKFICTDIKSVLTPDSLINPGPVSCPAGSPNIGISWNGSQYELTCSGTPVPPSNSCSSVCDCPGAYDACISGTCQPQSSSGSCIPGTVVKGDGSCQYLCGVGGAWTCSAMSPACGGGPLNVDGGWSNWSGWGICKFGTQSRTRTCTNPTPQGTGAYCVGSASESRSCTPITPGPLCPLPPTAPAGKTIQTCSCPEWDCDKYYIAPPYTLCEHCL